MISFANANACVRMAVHAITTILENEEIGAREGCRQEEFLVLKDEVLYTGSK